MRPHAPDGLGCLSAYGEHDLGQPDGLARLGARRGEAHLQLEVTLEQVELHRLDDEVLAEGVGAEEGLHLHPLDEILLGEEGQAHLLYQGWQELRPTKIYKHTYCKTVQHGVEETQLTTSRHQNLSK